MIPGDTMERVLARVQYEPSDLAKRIKQALDGKVREGQVKPKESVQLTDFYEQAMRGYTYLGTEQSLPPAAAASRACAAGWSGRCPAPPRSPAGSRRGGRGPSGWRSLPARPACARAARPRLLRRLTHARADARRRGIVEPERMRANDRGIGEERRELDDVAQLANVSRPAVREERGAGVGGEGPARRQEVLGERQDVVRPRAQRRKRHREAAQPVVEVLAERAFAHPRPRDPGASRRSRARRCAAASARPPASPPLLRARAAA